MDRQQLLSGRSTPVTIEGESASLLDSSTPSRSYGAAAASSASPNAVPSSSSLDSVAPVRMERGASQMRREERKKRRKEQWRSYRRRATYYVPATAWIPSYRLPHLGGDIVAALTLASILVPQSISYSTLSGVSSVHGLFAAAIPPMIYSLFGTCRQLSVGPEAALSLIIGEAVRSFIADEEHAHGPVSSARKLAVGATVASVITFQSGLVAFALGLLRLGFLDSVLSRALLRGFVTAIGIVILITQLIPLLGLEPILAQVPAIEGTAARFAFVVQNIQKTHRLTLLISVVAVTVLISARSLKNRLIAKGQRWVSFIPDVLVVVVLSTALTGTFKWDERGLAVLGKVETAEAKIRLPFYPATSYFKDCLDTSIVVAVLGFLDSIVAAKDTASKYDYAISPNRELVALGASNLVASFFRGTLPGFGSITRTRLACRTGATTQLSGLLTGAFVLLTTYFLMGWLYFLPKAILASIICVVVVGLIQEAPHDIAFYVHMSAWTELALMMLTFVLTLFVGVELGILVGVAISMIMCIKQSASMRIKILGRVPFTSMYEPIEDDDEDALFPPQEEISGVLIVRFRDSSLTFANAGAMKERLRRLEQFGHAKHHPSDEPTRAAAQCVVFSLSDIEEIDASALQILLEVVQAYVARGVLVYWADVHASANAKLRRAGILDASGPDCMHTTVHKALEALNDSHALPSSGAH